MVPAILLSGFATPIENMPEWLQTLTLANPLRYYLAIIKGVFLKGMPAAIVLQLLWPLAVIALVDALGGNLAVPPSGRVEIGADDLSVHSSANSSLNGSTKPGSTSPPSSDWPSLIRTELVDGCVDLRRSLPRVHHPDQSHASCEVFPKFLLHLGLGVALAEHLDGEVRGEMGIGFLGRLRFGSRSHEVKATSGMRTRPGKSLNRAVCAGHDPQLVPSHERAQ